MNDRRRVIVRLIKKSNIHRSGADVIIRRQEEEIQMINRILKKQMR